MTVQTTYAINQSAGIAGSLFDINSADLVSKLIETAAGADFAVAISRGTTDEQAVIGGTSFVGITARDTTKEGEKDGTIKYKQKDVATVMQKGYMYVPCPGGCTQGDAVKYNNTTGVIDAGTAGAGETQIDSAEWTKTTSAGEIGVVHLPNINSTTGS